MNCASRAAAFLVGAAAYVVETWAETVLGALAVPAAILAAAVPETRENKQ